MSTIQSHATLFATVCLFAYRGMVCLSGSLLLRLMMMMMMGSNVFELK
jgi:hypothetical protein